MAKKSEPTRRRPSLQSIYIHHIIWGCICLLLFGLLLALWFNTQSLNRKTLALEQQLSRTTSSCEARDTWAAGTTKKFDITVGTATRSYYVHLPQDFSSTAFYPLLMFFPGKSTTALSGQQQSGFDAFPAVTVYPEPTVGRDNYVSWQGAPYSSGANDVQFVSNILDKIQAQLCIERTRVYAAGMSNGGGMVSLLSCQLPDRFAAYGIVAGAMYYPAGGCAPPKPTPLINIHGDTDSIVPYNGSTQRRLPQIDGWIARRAHENNCSSVPVIAQQDFSSTTTMWQFCKNGATVQNVRLHNTDHAWLPSAAQTLWQFFMNHNL